MGLGQIEDRRGCSAESRWEGVDIRDLVESQYRLGWTDCTGCPGMRRRLLTRLHRPARRFVGLDVGRPGDDCAEPALAHACKLGFGQVRTLGPGARVAGYAVVIGRLVGVFTLLLARGVGDNRSRQGRVGNRLGRAAGRSDTPRRWTVIQARFPLPADAPRPRSG
jgi:hypothetical protein